MRTEPTLTVVSGKVDIVPLVDVVFLLLIFFLISSSLVFQPGVPVELPKSYTDSMRAAEKIVVTITKTGLLFFNDNPVEWEELERELREIVHNRVMMEARSPGTGDVHAGPFTPMLVLRADASVTYEKIIQVMSLARSLDLGVYLVTDATAAANRGGRRGGP